MTAGMPGTGIGGLFYLLSALLMPLRELWRFAASGGSRRPDVRAWRQSVMALGIVAMIYVTGLMMVWLGIIDPVTNATGLLRLILLYPAAIAFGTLFFVLAGVEMLAAAFRYAREREDAGPPLTPAAGIAPSNDGGAGR